MANAEKEYIASCKQLIEDKFHFQSENGTLRLRDLEYLADAIEEKSGIKLSISTLQRLWKKNYDQTPHPSTLQALVSLLGYKDWQEFKLEKVNGLENESIVKRKKYKPFSSPWLALPALVAFIILFWLIAFRRASSKMKPRVKGAATFTGNKTVAQGVPNTVIFHYDVSQVEADSFFFQQSWNEMEKVKINPKEHYYSNIYYYPGFHRAKLIANDSVIKRFKVHITTDGWLPLVRRSFEDSMPMQIKKKPPPINGALHITQKDFSTSDLNTKNFILSYFNVREFENTYSDNFSVDTRIKCDSNNAIPCPLFELTIICEEHIFYVDLAGKGCERNIGIKMGEVYHDGMNSDLSALGRELYQWQHLRIQVMNKQATIYLDEQLVHTLHFKNDFGKIAGLAFNFSGTGAIDYVKLKNGENKIVYEDDFNK